MKADRAANTTIFAAKSGESIPKSCKIHMPNLHLELTMTNKYQLQLNQRN